MATVFDPPVTTNRMGQLLHAHPQATEVIARLRRLLAVPNHDRHRQANRLQAFPPAQLVQVLRRRHLQVGPLLRATVADFLGLCCRALAWAKSSSICSTR